MYYPVYPSQEYINRNILEFQVEYFFDENCEECDIFRIDRTSGEIRLIGDLVENKDTYTLLVNARDGDGTMPADMRNEAPSKYPSRQFIYSMKCNLSLLLVGIVEFRS